MRDLEPAAVDAARNSAKAEPISTRTGLQHLDEALRRVLRQNAGAVDRLDEGARAAVHDRHFRAVDLDRRRCPRQARTAPRADARPSPRRRRADRRARCKARSRRRTPMERRDLDVGGARQACAAGRTMPVFGSAGQSAMETGLPLCTPMPERLTRAASASSAGEFCEELMNPFVVPWSAASGPLFVWRPESGHASPVARQIPAAGARPPIKRFLPFVTSSSAAGALASAARRNARRGCRRVAAS